MSEIHIDKIIDVVENLCIEANFYLNEDIVHALESGVHIEESETAKYVLRCLIDNAEIARTQNLAICQDTGMASIFVEVGQDVHVIGGNITDAINEGVRRGYKNGYLRKSVVNDPILRQNTNDNTPAVIYYDIVPGDKIRIVVAPKGFGSENMSAIKMLKPSDGLYGIKDFVVQTVKNAGSNPCPPIIVGVGIGGTMDKAALLSKKALLRTLNKPHILQHINELENELLESINSLGIGPGGFGGKLTALSVHIEVFPTHIAGLPVAVSIGCNATRHKEREI